MLGTYFPIARDIKNHGLRYLGLDFTAGATVAIILIPQAIAYSYLAGLPPIYGLYAGLVPLLIFGLMSSSRSVSIGPVAISSILIYSGLSQLAEPFSETFIELAILTGIIVGIVQFAIGLFRIGWVVNFLSHPVITGFVAGAACIIIVSQLPSLLGIQNLSSGDTWHHCIEIIKHGPDIQPLTLTIGITSLIILLVSKKLSDKFPTPLLLVVAGMLIGYFANIENLGVSIVGNIPKGLPSISFPAINFEILKSIFPTVLTVSLMGVVETVSIAKSTEMSSEKKYLQINQEMIALGTSKIVGGFFQSLPSSASFSRTAINVKMGGKTGMSAIISAIIVAIALLFLTSELYYLPKVILSSIIIFSVIRLINVSEAKQLLKIRKRDFTVMLITFVTTIILGIQAGVVTGIILSFSMILYASSRPHVAELGRLPETETYRNITRFPEAIINQKVVILRFDYQLYFWNMEYFKDTVKHFISKRSSTPDYVVLEAAIINDLDSTGLRGLQDVNAYLEEQGIELLISGLIGPVRDILGKSGFMDELGKSRQFATLKDAMRYIENPNDYKVNETPFQTNIIKRRKKNISKKK